MATNDKSNSGASPQTSESKPALANTYHDGNEITRAGKFWAGFLLILLTLSSGLYLIGHWPDRLPNPKDDILALYTYEWFHVRLANIPDTGKIISSGTRTVVSETGIIDTTRTAGDTVAQADSPAMGPPATLNVSPVTKDSPARENRPCDCGLWEECNLIHINTLLLILVAVAGFLGNMIHLATSFTTFIGAGKFKKSWILWYCVKPFTASALAVAIYFVFRGGFLNMSDDSTNINIYGVMTLSLLTGLFTDRATVKLKEVFDVLLRPKEERPDQLENDDPKITEVKSEPLEAGKPSTITFTGQNLSTGTLDISVEGQPITDVSRTPDKCSFSYTLPDELKGRDAVTLTVKFEKLAQASEFKLLVKPASDPGTGQPGNDADTVKDASDVVPNGPDVEEGDNPIAKE